MARKNGLTQLPIFRRLFSRRTRPVPAPAALTPPPAREEQADQPAASSNSNSDPAGSPVVRCKGTTRDGRPCRSTILQANGYCRAHQSQDPEVEAREEEISSVQEHYHYVISWTLGLEGRSVYTRDSQGYGPTALYAHDVHYARLLDPAASSDTKRRAIEHLIGDEQGHQTLGKDCISQAFLLQVLNGDSTIVDDAVRGLVQLGAWDELGALARVYIAPLDELPAWPDKYRRLWSQGISDSHGSFRLERILEEGLARPIDTDVLWPAVRHYLLPLDPALYRRAIRLCGRLHIAAALPDLMQATRMLPAGNPARLDAFEAIGCIGTDGAVDYLLQLVSERKDDWHDVSCGLTATCSPRCLPAFDQILGGSIDRFTATEVIGALGEMGGDEAARVLLNHLPGRYGEWVVEALGKTRSGLAVAPLAALLTNGRMTRSTRDTVAEALSQIDTPEARQVLATTLARGSVPASSSAGTALRGRRRE